MKKILMMAFTIALFLCSSSAASAFTDFVPRGSAVVNGMFARVTSTSYGKFQFYVTNISGGNVKCRVTVYDHNGADITSYSEVYTGSNPDSGWTLVASGTGDFEIPALATRVFQFGTSNLPGYNVCHALIEWDSDDPGIRKSLLATVRFMQLSGSEHITTEWAVNGGELF